MKVFQCLTFGTVVFRRLTFCMNVVDIYIYKSIPQNVQANSCMQTTWRLFKIKHIFMSIRLSYFYYIYLFFNYQTRII